MRCHRTALGVVAALAIASCATPYQQDGLSGGYSDRKINDSAYVVSFGGNGYASKERIWYFWTYRCAQLTLQSGYQLFSIRLPERPSAAAQSAGSLRPAVYDPNEQGRFLKVGTVFVPVIVPTGGGPPKWAFSGTVLMFHRPLPQGVSWAMDAQEVMQELDAYVASNGKAAVPSPNEVIARAFTAHASIGLGDGLTLTAGPPDGSQASSGTAVPRSATDVREAMDGTRLLPIYQAYEAYVLRTGTHPAGSIHLAFDVSPNGIVSNCRVLSTTFSDPAFGKAILNLVQTADFGARNVITTAVTDFPITFAPR